MLFARRKALVKIFALLRNDILQGLRELVKAHSGRHGWYFVSITGCSGWLL